ncbi:MAG: double-strand break repair helicase AddA [Parvularculaceae bacterium]
MNAAAIEETTRAQRRAANPSLSAFVPANAGAGKTRVLTNRVARLLLAGADPSAILCITFTKAAAAEMADRLFNLLGGFALADDATLTRALEDLDGDAARARGCDELSKARRLFARALETPGGLKIQTIHSFCESVLKRFPLEAGVAPGFSVIDALEATRLAREAVDSVATSSENDPAFNHLLSRMNGDALRMLLESAATARRRDFAAAAAIGWEALRDAAREALGATRDAQSLRQAIASLRPRADFERAFAAYDACGGDPEKYGAKPLKRFLDAKDDEKRVEALTALFLTAKDQQRNDFATKALDNIDPSIRGFYLSAQKDFLPLRAALDAAIAFDDTRALYAVMERVFAAYQQAKTARAGLDFDDLIHLTRSLLSGEGAAWALYKLDQRLDHILLDEAQDTGPDAWDVIERPLEEFFAGAGARDAARSFFAVGDKKQSIYSFQGADAKLFDAKETDLGKKIAAAAAYENIPLKASFRTTAPVLQFVDALFARPAVFGGVSEAAPEHLCTREGMAGSVEIWPLVPKEKAEEADLWHAPFDQRTASNPKRRLAEAVAETIAGWLATGEMLASQGRPVAPGDIMILVQKRQALFHEMIRALARRGVPLAGADRMRLIEEQAVQDLLSYARAVLYDGDDLALAETLKSPFFNVEEDSLFALAHAREGSLWRALKARRAERPEWAAAASDIEIARSVALKDGPVAFFMHVLETGAPSGWRRLQARLGAPAREPVEEFLRFALDFESSNPRSLRLFLDAVAASDAETVRDSAEAGDAVRILTAHKAKGLEAPIVFMLDAHTPPNTKNKEAILVVEDGSGRRLPLLAIGEGKRTAALTAAAEAKKSAAWDEYRRLLYVAATRAEDRLYICGHQHGKGDPAKPEPDRKTWHALALDALGPEHETPEEKFGGKVRRIDCPQTAAPKAKRGDRPRTPAADLPDFLGKPAKTETRAPRLSPSALLPGADDAAYEPLRSGDAFLRGRILHRLLELLPEIEQGEREEAARRLVRRMEPRLDSASADALIAEAFAVLNDPRFAPVFAPGGRAEAAIGGAPKGARKDVLLAGQIDRLVILENRILIVDYKTNRPPPQRLEDVAPGYVAQLAAYRGLLQEIYPGHEIEAALLWTHDARLTPVPAEALDRAFAMTLA